MPTASISTMHRTASDTDDLVIVPRGYFEEMQRKLLFGPTLKGYESVSFKGKQYKVPLYQLKGRAALRLDSRVKKALREYQLGKIREIRSLADLD